MFKIVESEFVRPNLPKHEFVVLGRQGFMRLPCVGLASWLTISFKGEKLSEVVVNKLGVHKSSIAHFLPSLSIIFHFSPHSVQYLLGGRFSQ